MGKLFDFDSRVLMCRNCGGPLQTGFTGGQVTCGYCGTINVFTPRKEEPVEPAAVASDITEEERMALLNRQDGTQPEIPPAVSQLLSGGRLAPWKEGEALSMWRTTCGELAGGSDFSSAELLYFLTIILSNHYSEKNDSLRQRALFESALEVLTLPRHRQVIRGMLARNAALEGDAEAAEKWLEPCNPRSEDLESDSTYRVSRAEIATVRGDWDEVLRILGTGISDVPIVSYLDGKAIVQRANALERTGKPAEAAEQISLFIEANGAGGLGALKQILAVYSDSGVEMCPETLSAAMNVSSARAGKAEAEMANPGGVFGQVFAGAGLFMILLALALPLITRRATGEFVTGAWIASAFVGVMGIVFTATGIHHIRAGRKVIRLHTKGLEASGVLRGISFTGMRINKIPQYSLDMEVTLPGERPYAVTLKKTIPNADTDRYHTGAEFAVKVDPEDRSSVTLLG